jgi:hypothetical protein
MKFGPIIDRLLHPRARFYRHVLSLGYNCEVSFQFYRTFRFVESNVFAWVNTMTVDNLICALADIDRIGSEGWAFEGVMWRDVSTGIWFHGKTPMDVWTSGRYTQSDLDADRIELEGRVAHLKKKFLEVARDGRSKLFVFKYPPDETPDVNRVGKIHDVLVKLCEGPTDLLVVLEERMLPALKDADLPPGVLTASVSHYTPVKQATAVELSDVDGWRRIWKGFRPLRRIFKKKKFKFEN